MRLLSATLLVVLSGCGRTSFEVALQGESTFTGGPAGQALSAFPPLGGLAAVDFDTLPECVAQGVTRRQISLARVQTASLKVLAPADGDFSFLDSVQLVARGADTEQVFGQKNQVADLKLPAPTPTLMLELLQPDITQQVTGAPLTVVMRGKGTAPGSDTRVQANISVWVEASTR